MIGGAEVSVVAVVMVVVAKTVVTVAAAFDEDGWGDVGLEGGDDSLGGGSGAIGV